MRRPVAAARGRQAVQREPLSLRRRVVRTRSREEALEGLTRRLERLLGRQRRRLRVPAALNLDTGGSSADDVASAVDRACGDVVRAYGDVDRKCVKVSEVGDI